MDMNRHSVAYFGTTSLQNFNPQSALIGLKSSAFEMQHHNAMNTPVDQRLTVEEIAVELSLSDLFSSARMHQRRLGRKRSKDMYLTRVMGIVMNHTPASRVMHELIPNLYKGPLTNIGHRLTVAVDCKDPANPTIDQHDRLITAAYIDRTLGHLTNDFMARGLRLPANLTTFADSIVDCTAYINALPDQNFNLLFQEFMNTLQHNMSAYATPEYMTGVMNMAYGEVGEGEEIDAEDGIAVVPVGHSVTLVNLTSNELGWRMDYRGSNIDPKVTPTLDDIVSTLRADKSAFNYKSTYDWLLTGDGQTYLVYESPEDPGNFRLFPVSGLNINNLGTIG